MNGAAIYFLSFSAGDRTRANLQLEREVRRNDTFITSFFCKLQLIAQGFLMSPAFPWAPSLASLLFVPPNGRVHCAMFLSQNEFFSSHLLTLTIFYVSFNHLLFFEASQSTPAIMSLPFKTPVTLHIAWCPVNLLIATRNKFVMEMMGLLRTKYARVLFSHKLEEQSTALIFLNNSILETEGD